MTDTKNSGNDKKTTSLAIAGWIVIILFACFLLSTCSGSGSSSRGSSSAGSSNYSSGKSTSSSSETLLDEDDWLDTEDGKTYLKLDESDSGSTWTDTDGDYVVRRNSDGTGAIADSNGNVARDTDGDGKLDSLSTDNGKTWDSLK